MRIKLSILSKLSLLVMGAVLLTAFAINEVYVHGSRQILTERALANLENETDYIRYPLSGEIKQLKADAELLSKLSSTTALVRASLHNGVDPIDGLSTQQLNNRLAVTFSEMLSTRKDYQQIRFIGVKNNGQDLIAIERFGNRIERITSSKLQQNFQERYFQDALRLIPGEVYLSEPSLAKQNGKIVLPHTLVLQTGIPIYTPEKEPFGIILITMNLGLVLQDIQQQLPESRTLYITNSSGDYLLHPDKSKLFATDLKHDRRVQQDNSWLIPVMNHSNQVHATFIPQEISGEVYAFQKYFYDPLNPKNYLGIIVQAPYSTIVSKINEVETRGIVFSAIVAFLAVIVAILLLRILIRPLNRVADAVVRYRRGEKNIELPTDSPDEIGILSREFTAMMKQKGEEDWVKGNLVTIARSLLGFKELSGFANSLMQVLTPIVNAQVGVFYISSTFARKQDKGDAETLIFIGACGFKDADQHTTPRMFRWGEGLVGSCARCREKMLVSDIPSNYLRISSGLGESKPTQLLLMPILFENSLVGVIELASVNEFSENHLAFLEQASFNIGVIINSISAGMRTQELLEETRQTAEELQRNEEELKTQQEELESANEEMEEKTRALEEQNNRIKLQSAELEESKKMLEDKARELELSNRYKSEFLANMSHELRTPLNSLLILARSLASNEQGNLTEEQVEEARVIHNGGLELLSLINDILDLSKVEAGKLTLVPEDVYLADMIKDLSQQFDPIAKESGVAFKLELDPTLPKTIFTDSQRVEQILKNLLSNAFKFTEKGAVTLNIHLPKNETELQRTSLLGNHVIAFTVSDTGIGIESNKLKDIFEAFQQEDGSIDRHYGGTGLGLTIARKFAHMLGGEIHVASQKDQGSAFTLYLPTKFSEEKSAVEENIPFAVITSQPKAISPELAPKAAVKLFINDDRKSIRTGDKVILIIEDDRNFAEILINISRKHGYKCLSAGDGKSGILLTSEYPITAIILDLKLPDMNGMEVLNQLKQNLKTRHIPVHIISGVDTEDGLAPLRMGAIGYLTKPVAAEEMNQVFSRIEDIIHSELKKILVVEDDKNTQMAIQSLLKHKEVEINIASSGNSALSQMRSARFDCVILDLKLPDMTGAELLAAFEKEFQAENPTPIIIYTAKELTEDENRYLNRYTNSIIIKGASSSDRLLDEVTLFLHSVESKLSQDQQTIIRLQHDPDRVLQNRTVLLVDDDLRNTFALSKLLKKHGMNVVIADNGKMALEKLVEEKSIEVVIMDIMMPIMDGYQAMQEIRQNSQWKNIPIIALTARAMPEEQERCIVAGANDYLIKPVDTDRLLTLLRVWLFKQEAVA
ncbi:MAG: response regulator [Legionellales bacterium]|nr:response regulator [Legionellales bacterium]